MLDLSDPICEVHHRMQSLGGDAVLDLSFDPTITRPLSLARLLVGSLATFVVVLSAGLVVAATAPRLFGYEPVVVTSGSMEPTIKIADIVVTSPSDGNNLGPGAVINYDHNGQQRLHRIAAVTLDGYRTAGDANLAWDTALVSPALVRGTGVVVVPFIGAVRIWFDEGRWLPLLMTLGALIAALYTSRSSWSEPKGLLR